MSTKIGPFEILNELAKSSTGAVYKANDSQKGQTIALKAIELSAFGESAGELESALEEEAEQTKILASSNINPIYGAGNIEGKFCAAMEYVQGNSIATMLARKEGFSIWDLQDIARQTCQGLDHARVHNVAHYSLEPAKIMVSWDGTVKILGFGVSTMGAGAAQAAGKAPEVLHYMSPEQLRGDPVDARSNLFSLGAILYEMVTERKAFEGEDADQVRQQILEQVPAAPDKINRKIHAALSEVIMRALSKAPEARYQSGQELVNDLERCKESAAKSVAKKPGEAPQVAKEQQKSAPAVGTPRPTRQTPATDSGGDAPPPLRKAAAAPAGGGMSPATTAEPEGAAARFSVDPMMDEGNQSAALRGPSFSEVNELPPLKEVYVAPPPLAEDKVPDQLPVTASKKALPEKP